MHFCRRSFFVYLILCCFCSIPQLTFGQLVINVRNKGGDVLQETISANVTQDTINLEFQRPEGTFITHFIDFKNQVQIFKALILGEEERGQLSAGSQMVQGVCFVLGLDKNDFISSDAMAKLRQKNPGAIRQAEEDRLLESHVMDSYIDLDQSSIISEHISQVCGSEAAITNDNAIYTRSADILQLEQHRVKNDSSLNVNLTLATRPFTHESPTDSQDKQLTTTTMLNFLSRRNESVLAVLKQYSSTTTLLAANSLPLPIEKQGVGESPSEFLVRCKNVKELWRQCLCRFEICIGWYPCGLKYCKGKDSSNGKMVNYRCGIKTCKKCRSFDYFVTHKQSCLWDD